MPGRIVDMAYAYAGMGSVSVHSYDKGTDQVLTCRDGGANGFERQSNRAQRVRAVHAHARGEDSRTCAFAASSSGGRTRSAQRPIPAAQNDSSTSASGTEMHLPAAYPPGAEAKQPLKLGLDVRRACLIDPLHRRCQVRRLPPPKPPFPPDLARARPEHALRLRHRATSGAAGAAVAAESRDRAPRMPSHVCRYMLFLGAPPAVVAAPVAYYDVDAEAPPDEEDDNPVARRGPKED